MDQLTDQQRRRIYQEEKKKDEANRGRAANRRSVGCLVAVGLVLLLIALVPVLGRSGAFGGLLSRSDDEAPAVTPAVTRVPAPAAGARTSFGDGAWLVGPEVEPGTYRTDGPSSRCYWSRLAEFSNVKAFIDRSDAASGSDLGPEVGADQVIVVRIRGGRRRIRDDRMWNVAPRGGVGTVDQGTAWPRALGEDDLVLERRTRGSAGG